MLFKSQKRLVLTITYLVIVSSILSACGLTDSSPISNPAVQATGEVTPDCPDPNAPCLLPTSIQSLTPQTETKIPAEQQIAEVPRVDAETARQAFDDGSAVFIDVRSEALYAQSHIPGALNIPLPVLESRYTELDPRAWIITYCT